MADENQSEKTRRTFMKGAAATGVAATGITAFSGGAAGQQNPVNVDASDLTIGDQEGQQVAQGLINVQVQNVIVAIQDVLTVQIGDDLVDIEEINILSDNEVNIAVADVVDVAGNQVQVAVTVLGETRQGQEQEFTGVDVVQVDQQT